MMAGSRRDWLLLLNLVLLLQAGCAPRALTPLHFRVEAPARFKGGNANAERIEGKWWEAYQDDVLNRLVETTLRNNPAMDIVYARLKAAREQVKVASSGSRPRVDGSTGVNYSRTSPNTPLGAAFGHQSIKGPQYTVQVGASWEPDMWQRVANAVEIADSKVELAKIDIDALTLLLCTEVVQFYWLMRSAEAELGMLRAIHQSRVEAERVLQTRHKSGLVGDLELATARMEVANATADFEDARRRRELNEHHLATLTGRPLAEFSVPPAPADGQKDFLLPAPPRMTPGLPADMLARRPDMAATTQNIRAAIADRHIAEAAFYPSIKLTGDFGFASKELQTLAQGTQLSLGPLAISLPLFDGGRNKAHLAASDARHQEAMAAHKSKLLLALREVDDALTEMATNEAAVKRRQEALDAARQAEKITRFRYDKGLTDYMAVMGAQRTTLSIARAVLHNRSQALVASVQLVRAVGGGWNAGEAVTPAHLYR